MEQISVLKFNVWTKDHITNEGNFDNNGNIIMENKVNHKSTGIISKIFEDHWNDFYNKYKSILDITRANANIEVRKVIACSNHQLGSSVYLCDDCNELLFCHHTCKGKLCSSCGIKTQKIRTENILEKCLASEHRHITFTMPQDLTLWFINNLYSLNLIFDATNETIYSVSNGKFKKSIKIYNYKFKPGFFAFLHTFGRPLNFNPHIHVIFSHNLLYKNSFKYLKYLDYTALSKRFMFFLLNKMEKFFGNSFKKVKQDMINRYPNGFYVNNKLEDDGYKFNSIEELLRYVTRYCSRPVIAESRITDYDGQNITWFYIDHKDNKKHIIKESANDFIKKLVKHILPSNFRSIRSYGYYNKPSKLDNNTNKIVSKEKISFRKSLLKWTNSILYSFGRIPIKCPCCGNLMKLMFNVT